MHDFSGESFSSLLAASERKQPLDDVMGTGQGSNSSLVSSLPQGTVRLYRKNYEEVRIPPTPTAPMRPDEKLVCLLFSFFLITYNCFFPFLNVNP